MTFASLPDRSPIITLFSPCSLRVQCCRFLTSLRNSSLTSSIYVARRTVSSVYRRLDNFFPPVKPYSQLSMVFRIMYSPYIKQGTGCFLVSRRTPLNTEHSVLPSWSKNSFWHTDSGLKQRGVQEYLFPAPHSTACPIVRNQRLLWCRWYTKYGSVEFPVFLYNLTDVKYLLLLSSALQIACSTGICRLKK